MVEQVYGGACCRYCQGEPGGPVYPWQQLQGMMVVGSVRLVKGEFTGPGNGAALTRTFYCFSCYIAGFGKTDAQIYIFHEFKTKCRASCWRYYFHHHQAYCGHNNNHNNTTTVLLVWKAIFQRVHDVCHKQRFFPSRLLAPCRSHDASLSKS